MCVHSRYIKVETFFSKFFSLSVHNTFEDSETDVRDNGTESLNASESEYENLSNQQDSYHSHEHKNIRTRLSPGSFGNRPPLGTQKKMLTKTGYSRREFSREFNSSRESSKPTNTQHEFSMTFERRRNESGGRPKDMEAIYTEIAEINAKLKVNHNKSVSIYHKIFKITLTCHGLEK